MSDILRSKIFTAHPTVTHGISTKTFGTMKKDDGSIHHANILKFGKLSGINTLTICMDQKHTGNVMVVENDRELVVPNVDGLVTKNKKLSLGVVTADCLPILMYDPRKDVIGIAHAGSKGLLKNIIGNTIKAFVQTYNTDPKDLIVSIGPSIEQKCYIVGQDLIKLYKSAFPHYTSVYIEGNGTFFLDLRSVAIQDLRNEGVLKENIEVSPLCTKCNPESLYSYRAGDTMGRFISIIGFT
jgi:hypothetical protein